MVIKDGDYITRYCGHSTNLTYQTKDDDSVWLLEIQSKIIDAGYFNCKLSCLEDKTDHNCQCGHSIIPGRIINGQNVDQPGHTR